MSNAPKFRAWDKKLNIFTNYHICDDIILFYDKHTGAWLSSKKYSDRFVLMQSTGLRDRNGIEIFEGDIVNAVRISEEFFDDYVGAIEYDLCEYVIEDEKGTFDPLLNYYCEDTSYELHEITVIGNIYENIELLKK